MSNNLTNLDHLKAASIKAKSLTAQVAAAAAAATEELERSKQDKITGNNGQVVGFDADGNAVPQEAPKDGGPRYATCTTASGTTAKVAICDGFVLKTGSTVAVKFTYVNTTNSPTLNVNGTGAKPIKKYGSTGNMAYMWTAGAVVLLIYDGTNWVIENGTIATLTNYGLTKLSNDTGSISTSVASTPYAVYQVNNIAQNAMKLAQKIDTYTTKNIIASDEISKAAGLSAPFNILQGNVFSDGWALSEGAYVDRDGFLDAAYTSEGNNYRGSAIKDVEGIFFGHIYYLRLYATTVDFTANSIISVTFGNGDTEVIAQSIGSERSSPFSYRFPYVSTGNLWILIDSDGPCTIEKNIILYDLTEEFGAGNEPSKEEMDAHFSDEGAYINTLDDILNALIRSRI
ncbi:MAG: hypothetical protein HFF18_04245 [Oscillospiraceae bacterium]|nr:hypothetical protein [Oscillospiraceae bacterium]